MRNPPAEVWVLHLGHRLGRDERMTTHLGLVARAFGARGLLLASRDDRVAASLAAVSARWGGSFEVRQEVPWRREAREWKEGGGRLVHLSMYGEPLDRVAPAARLWRKVWVAVGSEKVPPDIYTLADRTVAVGHQPHSEVAALALFLDRCFRGRQLGLRFPGAMQQIPTGGSKGAGRKIETGRGAP
ncbi:MAG: tRNA (cytidine(56)-2'-O)-methyltransferase [Halobacteria archaeon]